MKEPSIDLKDWLYMGERAHLAPDVIRELANESNRKRQDAVLAKLTSPLIELTTHTRDNLLGFILAPSGENADARKALLFVKDYLYDYRNQENTDLTAPDIRALSFLTGALERGLAKGTLFNRNAEELAVLAFFINSLAKIYERIHYVYRSTRADVREIAGRLLPDEDEVLHILDIEPPIVQRLFEKTDAFLQRVGDGSYIEHELPLLQTELEDLEREKASMQIHQQEARRNVAVIQEGAEYQKLEQRYASDHIYPDDLMITIIRTIESADVLYRKISDLNFDEKLGLEYPHLRTLNRVMKLAERYIEKLCPEASKDPYMTDKYRNGIAIEPPVKILESAAASEREHSKFDDGQPYEPIIIEGHMQAFRTLAAALKRALDAYRKKHQPAPAPSASKKGVMRSFSDLKPQTDPTVEENIQTLEFALGLVDGLGGGVFADYRERAKKLTLIEHQQYALTSTDQKRANRLDYTLGTIRQKIAGLNANIRDLRSFEKLVSDQRISTAVTESRSLLQREMHDPSRPSGLYMLKTLLMIADDRKREARAGHDAPHETYFSVDRAFAKHTREVGYNPLYEFSRYDGSMYDKLHYRGDHWLYLECMYTALCRQKD